MDHQRDDERGGLAEGDDAVEGPFGGNVGVEVVEGFQSIGWRGVVAKRKEARIAREKTLDLWENLQLACDVKWGGAERLCNAPGAFAHGTVPSRNSYVWLSPSSYRMAAVIVSS